MNNVNYSAVEVIEASDNINNDFVDNEMGEFA